MLESERWDFITMQQYSMHSSDYDTYMPWADSLYNYMKELCPGAKIVWHQTWAYRNDARIFGQIGTDTATGKPVRARNDRQMWDGIVLSTEKLTGKLPLEVIPVGEAFQDIRCGKRTSYGKDPAFDFKKPRLSGPALHRITRLTWAITGTRTKNSSSTPTMPTRPDVISADWYGIRFFSGKTLQA